MAASTCTARARHRYSWRRPPPFAAAKPPLASLKPERSFLTCLVASHVSSAARAEELARMLKSIRAQVPSPPPVSMSWSATEEVAPRIRAVLREAIEGGLPLEHIEQPTRLTQFEHLRRLAARLTGRAPEWVFFSDDDDLWSERRGALYVRECAAAPLAARAVLCRRKAAFSSSRTIDDASDASSVRAMLRAGTLRLADSNLKDGVLEHEHNMAEYFDLALRFGAFAQFFASVPPLVTQHKLCDLAFTFLHSRDRNTVRWIPPDDDEFIYFYSRGARAGGASNTNEGVSQDELRRSEALLRQAPSSVPQFFTPSFTVEKFVANMRQALEQELIMIRVTGGVAPLQIVHAACAHEADICLQAGPCLLLSRRWPSVCAPRPSVPLARLCPFRGRRSARAGLECQRWLTPLARTVLSAGDRHRLGRLRSRARAALLGAGGGDGAAVRECRAPVPV